MRLRKWKEPKGDSGSQDHSQSHHGNHLSHKDITIIFGKQTQTWLQPLTARICHQPSFSAFLTPDSK